MIKRIASPYYIAAVVPAAASLFQSLPLLSLPPPPLIPLLTEPFCRRL